MPRRPLIVLSFLFLLTAFLFSTSKPVLALTIPGVTELESIKDKLDLIDNTMKEAGSYKNMAEFCDRRQGDQMNLETWYSGKCVDDTFSGEGVGFSDIVLLDLIEKVQGKTDPDEGMFQKMQKMIDFVNNSVSEGKSESEIKLALADQRKDILKPSDDGIIGAAGKGIAFLISNPPATTHSYIAYVSQNLQRHHIIPQALAQNDTTGYGYAGLAAFLPIWKMFRNLSYIVFVLFFIIYGFMMMFRVNISAKTVITVQLALPKLIATLLMITFSYAIVGLMVDLMYVIYFAFVSLMVSQKLILADGWLVTPASGQMGALFSLVVNGLVALPASAIGVLNLILGGPSAFSAALGILGFLSGIGMIIMLILFIAIAISYIRLFWKLLIAFLTVIISLITAPIVLLANAMPGSDTFGSWLRNIFANLSVFPITMILLTFSYMLMVQPLVNILGPTDPNANFNFFEWFFGVRNLNPGGFLMYVPFVSPPLASKLNFMGNAPDAMLALFGVALLLMASKYVDIVRDALKVPPFKYGAALGEALRTGINVNESLAKQGYRPLGIPVLPGKASRIYPGSPSVEPSLQVGGIDTGINIKKTSGK